MQERTRMPADILTAILIFALFAAVVFVLRNPTSLDDGLRHFAMALQMRDHGIAAVSGWNVFLYEGMLSRIAVDPWFLSDVIMIPFTYLPPVFGLHLFVVAALACLIGVSLFLLRSLSLRSGSVAFFLALLIFGDQQFTGRFLFARPYSIVTVLMLCILWAILERRWVMLMIMMAASVLVSQLFVFPLLVCLIASVSIFFSAQKRDAAMLFVFTCSGVIAGLLVHPHASAYVFYLMDAFLRIPFLGSIGLSDEMSSGLFNLSFVSVLCAWTVIIFLWVHARQAGIIRFFDRTHADVTWLCALCLIFTLEYIAWLRAIDVLWPLLVVCMARLYVLDPAFVRSLPDLFLPSNARMRTALLLACGVLCSGQMIATPYTFLRDDSLHSLSPFVSIQSVPAGSRVLNLDWDRFFMFVFLRPDLRYATGIDPAFTYLTDPMVLSIIRSLESGMDSPADARQSIHQLLTIYPSDAIALSLQRFSPVIGALKQDADFRLLSDTGSIAVFSVPDRYRK